MSDTVMAQYLRTVDAQCPECGAGLVALNGTRCPACTAPLELVLDLSGRRSRPSVLALAASLTGLLLFILPAASVIVAILSGARRGAGGKGLVVGSALAIGIAVTGGLVLFWRRRIRTSALRGDWPGWNRAILSLLANLVAAVLWVAVMAWA